jgi:penicillin amidase
LRPLFSLALPVGGDGTTVNVAHAGATRDGVPFGAVHAPGYRAIYDLAPDGRSRWIASTGQSGHPLSRHYRDLARLWQAGGYLTLDFAAPPAGPALTLRPDPAS